MSGPPPHAVAGRGRTRRVALALVVSVMILLGVVREMTHHAAAEGSGQGSAEGSGQGSGQAVTSAPVDPDQPQVPRHCLNFADSVIMNAVARCDLREHIPGAPTIMIWGDSHAWQEIPALEAAIGERRVNLVAFILGGCPLLDRPRVTPTSARANSCDAIGQLALHWLTRTSRHAQVHVVVALGWELYHDVRSHPQRPSRPYRQVRTPWIAQNAVRSVRGTPRAFRAVARLGVPVDVVGQMPMVYYGRPDCARGNEPYRCSLPRTGAIKDERANSAYIARLMRPLGSEARLVTPASYLCDARRCRGTVHGFPTFYDRFHIGARVSAAYGPTFFGPTVSATLRSAR